MSAETPVPADGRAWPLRWRQARAVMLQELRKSLSLRRGLWLLALAFAPTFIIVAHALGDRNHRVDEETLVLAVIIQIYYVRCGIFVGCLGLAMRLVRGEMAERTLHYPLLAPVRREVLMAGKFLAAALSAILVFGGGVLASLLAMYGHSEAGRAFLADGGLAHLGWYLLVAVLASLGYLAVLLALSLLFKNPVVPAAIFLVWEGINAFVPPWLKHLSVTFYLKPLFPVELPLRGLADLLTVVAEPTPAWLAVTGLLAFTVIVLALACWRIRSLEISYSTD